MSEELSVGVKILLERCKTNPEEIMGTKWLNVVEAVFNYKETRARSPSLRGLTEQEIDLIYEALNGLYRAKFDSYIMANVLNADEEEPVKPKKLTMTSAQVAIAKKLGVSPSQYATALLKGIK